MNIKVLASLDIFLYGAVVSLLAFVGKYLSALGALGKGMNTSIIGIGMVPRGEVGLIFASMGLVSGVLTKSEYSALTIMVMLTTFIAPPLLYKFFRDK